MMKYNKIERDLLNILLFIFLFFPLTIPLLIIFVINIIYEYNFKTNFFIYLSLLTFFIFVSIMVIIIYYFYMARVVGNYYYPDYYCIDNVIEFRSEKHYYVTYKDIQNIKEIKFYNKLRKNKHLMVITLKHGIHFEKIYYLNEDLNEYLLIAADNEDYFKLIRNFNISRMDQPVEAKVL